MNDILFSNGFRFFTFWFDKYHYTDNRAGASYHYFAYMQNGRCRITTDSATVHIQKGDIFYIPNKCSYQSYWYGDPEICFSSLGAPCLPNFGNFMYPVQVVPGDENAITLLCRLGEKRQLTAEDIGVFYTLAGILIPRMQPMIVSRSAEIVEKAKEYIRLHPFAKNDEIARGCAVSQSALYAAFQKSSEETLNALKNRFLLEKAGDMLIATDKPIEYVSDILRFSSVSYFRKKFRRHFGISPREMRKKHRI